MLLFETNWGSNPNQYQILLFERQNIIIGIISKRGLTLFYYQNNEEKQAGFLRFEISILNYKIPHWFYFWFHKIGPGPDVIPEDILKNILKLILN